MQPRLPGVLQTDAPGRNWMEPQTGGTGLPENGTQPAAQKEKEDPQSGEKTIGAAGFEK